VSQMPDQSKPPKSTPHSDLDGIHQDERPNVESARDAGQDSGDLERAHRDSAARPPYYDAEDGKKERT
jgi:hypothetical protein